MTNDNSQFDFRVHSLIAIGTATTSSDIASAVGDERVNNRHVNVENSLRRLKSKGFIAYDKATKRWTSLRTVSQPSASTCDSSVESEHINQPATPVTQIQKDNQMNDTVTENTETENTVTPSTETSGTGATDVDSIDAAIASAKRGKASAPSEPKRPRLTPEEKAEREEAERIAKELRKAERARVREAKRLEKESSKPAAHMSKVAKAQAKLLPLSKSAEVAFNELIANFPQQDLAVIASHLVHFNRAKATERALGEKVQVGATVRILTGDSRHIGAVGTVTKSQRIRCYVEVPGVKKPVYLFTSDVEVVESAPEAKVSNG